MCALVPVTPNALIAAIRGLLWLFFHSINCVGILMGMSFHEINWLGVLKFKCGGILLF
jgi:hypothetical protein